MLGSWTWFGGTANAQSSKVITSPPPVVISSSPKFFSSSSSSSSFFSSSFSSFSSSSLRAELLDVNLINESLRDSATTQIHSANDLVRYLLALRRLRIDPRTGRPITAFAPEAQVYDPFEALAYAKGGMVTKAPPAPAPAVSSWYVSAWGQGSGDQEHRDVRFGAGIINSRTTSFSGLGGIDVVKIGITSDSDALVIGLLGSATSTRTHALVDNVTKSSTPGAGMYVSYINGGFSADYSFLANFTSTDGIEAGVLFTNRDTDSYVSTANMQYKYDVPGGNWWVEPTAGFSYTRMYQHIVGVLLTDGQQLRLQAGARVGTEWTYGAVKVQPTLFGVAYSDVMVDLPHLVGIPFIGPTDEHYLWGKGVGKVNVQWTDKFSTFIEGEVRGRADVIGYAGRVAARYTF